MSEMSLAADDYSSHMANNIVACKPRSMHHETQRPLARLGFGGTYLKWQRAIRIRKSPRRLKWYPPQKMSNFVRENEIEWERQSRATGGLWIKELEDNCRISATVGPM